MIVRLVWTLLSPNLNPALAALASMSGFATCWSILDIVPGGRTDVKGLLFLAGKFAGVMGRQIHGRASATHSAGRSRPPIGTTTYCRPSCG